MCRRGSVRTQMPAVAIFAEFRFIRGWRRQSVEGTASARAIGAAVSRAHRDVAAATDHRCVNTSLAG